MEGKILLKTLTEKSVISAGKNAGSTVAELIMRSKISLIYMYFHYGNITFTKAVLEQLNIREEDYIQKPGKDPEKFNYYQNRNLYVSTKSLIKTKSGNNKEPNKAGILAAMSTRSKGYFRSKYKALIERERKTFSKGALQRINQGH
jgi:hypothetical protein